MSDPIRTPAEALEAAARIVTQLANAFGQAGMINAMASTDKAAAAIRALAPRIAAPDDGALSRLVAASEAPAGVDCLGEVRVRVSDLRDALREAGAPR